MLIAGGYHSLCIIVIVHSLIIVVRRYLSCSVVISIGIVILVICCIACPTRHSVNDEN